MDRQKAVRFIKTLSQYSEVTQKQVLIERDLRTYCTEIRSLLPDTEYKVILKRYINKMTFEEIGTELKVSRQRAKQIEQRGIERLKAIIDRSPHNLPEIK